MACNAQNSPTAQFSPSVALQWIHFKENNHGQIIIPVSINDVIVNALIDTGFRGSETISISDRLSYRLKIHSVGFKDVKGYDGDFKAKVVLIDNIKIGGSSLSDQRAVVAPPSANENDYDVVVGLSFIRYNLMQVDWSRSAVRFLLSGDVKPSTADMPLYIQSGSGFLMMPLNVCGVDRLFLVDSGDENDLNISPHASEIRRCAVRPGSSSSGYGSAGKPFIRRIVALPTIELAGRRVSSVVATIDQRSGPLSGWHITGTVGINVLRSASFIMDPTWHRFRFYGPDWSALRAGPPTVGVQFDDHGDILEVVHVAPHSPAAATPLRPGDKICAVDGRTIRSWAGNYPLKPTAGTRIFLKLCDGRSIGITARNYLFPKLDVQKAVSAGDSSALEEVGLATEALAECVRPEAASATVIAPCTTVVERLGIEDRVRAQARFTRAQAYVHMNRFTDAVTDLDVLVNDPWTDKAALLAVRAEAETKMKHFSEAKNDIDAAVALRPDAAYVYAIRALLAYEIKQVAAGLDDAKKAVALSTDDVEMHNTLAEGYVLAGRDDLAIQEANRVLKIDPNNADAIYTRGRVAQRFGRLDAAISDYRRALEIDPYQAEAASALNGLCGHENGHGGGSGSNVRASSHCSMDQAVAHH